MAAGVKQLLKLQSKVHHRDVLASVWSPAIASQAERSKTEPQTFMQGTNRLNGGGRMWEGAGRGECGELGGERDSRASKASTKAAGR